MRIEISGSHRTGKTTLLERLAEALPDYQVYEEPYYQLEREGHSFGGTPSLRDFELQLNRSIKSILDSEKDCLFDRCPSDFLAYLMCHRHTASFAMGQWLPRIREAMAALDLIVFVPIEHPDRISIPKSEQRELRRCVDEKLEDILLNNQLGFTCKITEVAGTTEQRVELALKDV